MTFVGDSFVTLAKVFFSTAGNFNRIDWQRYLSVIKITNYYYKMWNSWTLFLLTSEGQDVKY